MAPGPGDHGHHHHVPTNSCMSVMQSLTLTLDGRCPVVFTVVCWLTERYGGLGYETRERVHSTPKQLQLGLCVIRTRCIRGATHHNVTSTP